MEDIKSAVTYMSTITDVDPNRIGTLGICTSGGYVPFAAQADVRIKVVATVSAMDMGSLNRDGLKGTSGATEGTWAVEEQLADSAQQRIDEVNGGKPVLVPLVPNDPDEAVKSTLPNLLCERSMYYRGPRGLHP